MVPRPLLAPRDTGPERTPPKELVVCEEAGFALRFVGLSVSQTVARRMTVQRFAAGFSDEHMRRSTR